MLKNLLSVLGLVFGLSLALYADDAEAQYISAPVKVTGIHIQNIFDTQLFITFSGKVCFSRTGAAEREAKIFKSTSTNWQNTINLLTAAYLSQLPVSVQTKNDGNCQIDFLWLNR